MEVHHHAHTTRTKWTHYFWEFLMLFLAVFCGFLAEYQLEHKIEKEREKQFIRSMIRELEADMQQSRLVFQDSSRLKGLDSIQQAIHGKDFETIDRRHLYILKRKYISIASFMVFSKNTLSQLKNAGNMRLIRKQVVVDSLNYLDIMMNQLESIMKEYMQHASKNLEFGAGIFDDGVYREAGMYKGPYYVLYRKEEPGFLTRDYTKLTEFANRAGHQATILSNYHRLMRSYVKNVTSLILLIKKEYRVK